MLKSGDHGDCCFNKIDGKTVYGTLNNEPIWVKSVKFGDKTSVAVDKVVDWIYVNKQKDIVGFFSRDAIKRSKSSDAAPGRGK